MVSIRPKRWHNAYQAKSMPRQSRRLRNLFRRQPSSLIRERIARRSKQDREYLALEAVAQERGLAVIRDDGEARLAVPVRGISQRRARSRNLDLTSGILNEAKVPYFAVPDESRRHTSIGIEDEHWEAFAEHVLSQSLHPPLFLGLEAESPAGQRQRSTFSLADERAARTLRTASNVDLFQFYSDPDSHLHFGRSASCRVERWHRTDSSTLRSSSRALRTSEIGTDLLDSSTLSIHGQSVPSFSALTSPNIFESHEPIDAVYLWVDGQDAQWQLRRKAVIEQITGEITNDSVDPSRFRDNGELRYSLRSVFHHCDWIRNIVLVTDSQVPTWLDTDHPRIRMVDHAELFGDSGALPTYNSHAITSRLHHIDGLSERFLIFNDDVFVGRDIEPSAFFMSNGVSRFFMSRSTIPELSAYPLAHEAARKNTVDLIWRDFGVRVSRAFFHAPVPQQRSLLFELEQRYPDAFKATWSHQLRSADDFQINSWMHHYVGYLLRRTIPSSISYTYIGLDDKDLRTRLDALVDSRTAATFCINDSSSALPENIDFLQPWLERYFPIPAPWERDR